MSGLLAKLRVTILGNAHELLDKTIDLNSIPVLKQYVRDLETAIEKLKGEVANQDGTVIGLQREIATLNANIINETTTIQKILSSAIPNQNLAREKGTRVVGWKNELTSKTTELEQAQQMAQQLHTVMSNMNIKHTEILGRVKSLESTQAQTKAMKASVSATEAAGKLVNNGIDSSIDDVSARLMHEHDVATAQFNQTIGSINVEQNAETSASVDDLLASLAPQTATK